MNVSNENDFKQENLENDLIKIISAVKNNFYKIENNMQDEEESKSRINDEEIEYNDDFSKIKDIANKISTYLYLYR